MSSPSRLRARLQEILLNKGYKSFGDVLLNFLYSYHRYILVREIRGYKLRNEDLAKIFDKYLSQYFTRMDTHKKGDVIEGIVAYCFLHGLFSFQEMENLMKDEQFLEKLIKRCLEKLSDEL
ncbi:MAG: hypothetical protein GXO42_01765 [bacterium]|nr:hypothetical protein [bacterium]